MPEADYRLPAIAAWDALAAFRAGEATLVDLRKPEAVARSGHLVAGAIRRDPFAFGHDDSLCASPCPIVTFCVHGHEVSRFACALLLLHGVDARYVSGGFVALVEAGAELCRPSDGEGGK